MNWKETLGLWKDFLEKEEDLESARQYIIVLHLIHHDLEPWLFFRHGSMAPASASIDAYIHLLIIKHKCQVLITCSESGNSRKVDKQLEATTNDGE
jgi:hypothetical protein